MTEIRTPRRRQVILGGAALGMLVLTGGGVALVRRDRFAGLELTPDRALKMARSGATLLIDIRRPDEWAATGVPAGGHAIDMRRADFIEAVLALAGGDRTQPVALICARGVRSDRIGARLAAAGFAQIADVPEGMLGSSAGPGWLARGLPVTAP